ncbi:MAG: hypothetical protein OEY56_06805, partial [Cyclobacteriaceae bacterium]|nr:hypothetical protein [Cyclobacteriaceae bacterium]
DENNPNPADIFVKYYGSSGSQSLKDMILIASNHVVLLGDQKLSNLDADANVYLVEADSFGNEIQSTVISMNSYIYPDSLEYQTEEYPESIKEIASGYLVVGSYADIVGGQPQEKKIFWLHIDNDFSVLKWDTLAAPGYQLIGKDITLTSDNQVVIVGKTDRREPNDATQNAQFQYFISKRDFNADTTIWRKSYGYGGSDDEAIAVFELSGGELAIIGSTSHVGSIGGETGKNVGMMVFNSLGTSQISAKEYGISLNGNSASNEVAHDVIEIPGGYVITGTSSFGTDSQPFVMGLSRYGSLIFRAIVPSKYGLNREGRSVTTTYTNDLVIVGRYPSFLVTDEQIDPVLRSKNGEILLVKTGQTGYADPITERNYGLVAGNDVGEVVLSLPTGSLLIGATFDFGSSQSMIGLMKMNDSGELYR